MNDDFLRDDRFDFSDDEVAWCNECGDPAYMCECQGRDWAADLEDEDR